MIHIKLENIKIREDIDNNEVIKRTCNEFKIPYKLITDYKILKKSIDSRNKKDIFYNYSILITLLEDKININKLKNNKKISIVKKIEEPNLIDESKLTRNFTNRPIIIGAGPAGLFCALTLISNGVKPIIIEQGSRIEDRQKEVRNFLEKGILNPLSNVQFGEGGAGTFSDGKLTTNLNSPYCRTVINQFIRFGAPEQIAYINKPHIGTDNLIKIILNIRNYIIEQGGEFLFNTKAIDFDIKKNKVCSIICSRGNEKIEIKTNIVVLAIGHSSRDMFETLYNKNINIEKKNFSVGVRIEHKQEMINKSQYGEYTKLNLPPAEYKLAYHGKERSCYTFCMCPGGNVIASSSERNTIVTNGMSYFSRSGENANSALLVNVTPEDFKGKSPLEGMYFQKRLEEAAFNLGGKNYYAPIQRVEDFINNRPSTFIGDVKPTYKPGVKLSNLREILPQFVNKTLAEGIIYFDKKIAGFANSDAILVGVETRSSSPITIKRNEKLISNIDGIYPCGEGAGYAGGIMSAAIDGIKIAKSILES